MIPTSRPIFSSTFTSPVTFLTPGFTDFEGFCPFSKTVVVVDVDSYSKLTSPLSSAVKKTEPVTLTIPAQLNSITLATGMSI